MGIYKPSEVKAMRVRLGLTQAKLAELAGVTQAYIAKIEAGGADPRVSTLEKISRALELASAGGKRISVGQIMSAPIVSVSPSDRIERAVRLMKSHEISQLPVLEGGVPVGSVSETTIVRKVASGENIAKLLKRCISEIMNGPLPTVRKDSDIDVAYHLLEHEPGVVVLDGGKAVGIVAKADVFKLTGKSKS